ncbi:hypothetical protein M9H77_29075 [Catharanthus roseus]|uniref:Uncharacterized protein n=1 Tax=Catharanthus roseus TaxID=4058 RepID=A0ACC0AH49_CATRO|nr:hypothetical protein M9H77_29075 [Catharanthus roseus]
MGSSSANLWVLLGLGIAGILIMTKKLKKAVRADFGAFVERLQLLPPPPPPPPKAPHPLNGLTFAVSDVFDIDGYVTGFGNPDWSRTHGAASQTSSVVSALVEGGATCTGKSVVDDMAFSISGENKHYDTPTNPAAPAKVPGGSSSGAAVAVAASLVDFSLGIDTVGGVRVPAGYCGVLGFRPSHGTVPQMGMIPVSASLDTVGWFARDPQILRRVGHVLLQVPLAVQRNPRSIIIADDCFHSSNVSDRVTQAVIKSIEKLFGRQAIRHEKLGDYVNSKVPSLKAFQTGKANGEVKTSPLWSLANVMQVLKRHEFKQNHEEWIKSVKPTLDPVISAQLREGLDVTDKEVENCLSVRNELRSALNLLLKDDGILIIPTTPDFPPKVGSKDVLSEEYHIRAYTFTSLASMSGCCQAAVPMGFDEKCPVSVSFIARHGGDRFLLDTVQTMYAVLQEEADLAAKVKPSKNVVSQETSAEMAKEKGNQAFKDKQWQKAIGFYTEAIKINGNNATYYSNRAAAYLELGSFLQAEADCTKAIDLDKKNVKSYLRRGTAREMLGYYKEAIEDFRYALVLEPNNKRAAQSAERLRRLFQ